MHAEPFDLILHGHFYQPPREDPWTHEVPEEFGAAPFHDWNERINEECYRANAFARVCDDQGRILRLVNNYSLLSFNVGPTLAGWLDRHDPETLERMVEADRRAAPVSGGSGAAIAQPWIHAILPLADALDRATLVRWGQLDFQHRFGRAARGMWLPETAADNATLATLIEAGIEFTILAPHQARRVRPLGGAFDEWREVTGGRIDPSRPYRFLHPDGSGRGLAVFFYDGRLAQAIAFGGALATTAALGHALVEASRRAPGGLVHAAVDGETMGHHVAFGDRTLAHALGESLDASNVRLTTYEEFLSRRAPEMEVELDLGSLGEGTAWSCAHGVGRWVRDCGCRTRRDTHQAWRGPLRAGFDHLRDAGRQLFLEQASDLVMDPWSLRHDAIELWLEPAPRERNALLRRHAWGRLVRDERQRLFALLRMQRHLLTMYTSCGWFFDEIAGLETVLVLRHAARAIEEWSHLDEAGARRAEGSLLDHLSSARGNDASEGTGADVYLRSRPSGSSRAYHASRRRPLLGAVRRFLRESSVSDTESSGHFVHAVESLAAPSEETAEAAGDVLARAELKRAQEALWSGWTAPSPAASRVAAALGFAPEWTGELGRNGESARSLPIETERTFESQHANANQGRAPWPT